MASRKGVNCYRCEHFSITWLKRRPYQCAAYGFQSPKLPSTLVYSFSGLRCQLFKPKDPKPPSRSRPPESNFERKA